MKKILSILTVVAMLAVMIPVSTVGAFAETNATKPTDTWTTNIEYVDLSVFPTLDAASDKTVTVGEKHYRIYGDFASNESEYEISTAAQLAGLAYLSNRASGDFFKAVTFKITQDIDLGAHLWDPIGKLRKFRGSLVGDVEGEPATISNMSIDTSAQSGVSVGLVGKFGGGCIKNLTLVNAEIIAKNSEVGSFVGFQESNIGVGQPNSQGSYENLISDASITVISGEDDRFDDVGGIVGRISGCTDSYPDSQIKGCVFTGSISAPYGDLVGGIVGMSQSTGAGLQISDCVVVAEKIEWGKNNAYIAGKEGDHNTGMGGIAGILYSNGNDEYAVKNCYVAAKLVTLPTEGTKTAKYVGGIVGGSCGQAKSFENCQFDGIISGEADGIGGMLGRYLSPITFKNCVVSGVAIRTDGKTSALVGTSANDRLTVDGAYGSLKMLSGVGGTEITQITTATDLSALLAVKNGDVNVWTRAVGQLYPVLTIALPYLTGNTPSVAKSGADLGFIDLESTETVTVSTVAQLDAVAAVLGALSERNANALTNRLNVTLEVNGELLGRYDESVRAYISFATGYDPTADDSRISMEFAQIALEKNVNDEKPMFDGTYNVRIVAKMKDTSFTGVKFDYAVIQDGAATLSAESAVITECYRSLIETVSGTDNVVEAGDGCYFVVFVIKNVRLDNVESTVLTLRANGVTADGGTVKSSKVNITLTVPEN